MSFLHSLAWMEHLADVRLGRLGVGEHPPVNIEKCRFCGRSPGFLFLDEQGAYCGDDDCESHVLAEARR